LNLKFRLKDNIENLPQKVNDHLQKLEHVENLKLQSRSHEDRLKGISEELDSLKDVDKLEKDRIRLKTIHDNIEADIEILKNEIDYLEEDIKSILRDIKKVGEIDLKDEEYSKKTKFISEIINQIENVKINIIDSTRKDIEKFSSEIYKKLYRHAAEVDRLELDTNYQTRVVIKKDGKEYVKTNFSTGEGLVFAISFLTGLRKYSGYNGPIFLDSPYSVLDEEHRTRVSLNLPQTVPGQLIVFTRPDTFEDIKNDMMPHINKLIKLVKEKEWHVKIIK